MTTYVARFTPEAWSNDQAIEVDAEGPTEWDCTAYALAHLDYLENVAKPWSDAPGDLTDTDDVFKNDPAAPDWIRAWRGPFTIHIIPESTGVDSPDGSTQEPCGDCKAPVGQPCEIWCIADQGTAR